MNLKKIVVKNRVCYYFYEIVILLILTLEQIMLFLN